MASPTQRPSLLTLPTELIVAILDYINHPYCVSILSPHSPVSVQSLQNDRFISEDGSAYECRPRTNGTLYNVMLVNKAFHNMVQQKGGLSAKFEGFLHVDFNINLLCDGSNVSFESFSNTHRDRITTVLTKPIAPNGDILKQLFPKLEMMKLDLSKLINDDYGPESTRSPLTSYMDWINCAPKVAAILAMIKMLWPSLPYRVELQAFLDVMESKPWLPDANDLPGPVTPQPVSVLDVNRIHDFIEFVLVVGSDYQIEHFRTSLLRSPECAFVYKHGRYFEGRDLVTSELRRLRPYLWPDSLKSVRSEMLKPKQNH